MERLESSDNVFSIAFVVIRPWNNLAGSTGKGRFDSGNMNGGLGEESDDYHIFRIQQRSAVWKTFGR